MVGGGSDLPEYYQKGDAGEVVGFALNYHICTYVNKPLLIDSSLVKYSVTEAFDNPNTIEHPLFREVLKKYWLPQEKLEIASFADIRSGTGLGSSSAFAVALISVLKYMSGIKFTPFSLTNAAFDIERNILGEPVGLQDAAFAAYGGCSHFRFKPGHRIEHTSINLENDALDFMTSCIYLVFTQQSRNASASLLKHTSNIVSSEDKYQLQKHITSLVPNAKFIKSSNMKELGELVRDPTNPRNSNGHSSNSPVHTGLEAISDLFTDSSIWGYKLLESCKRLLLSG